MRSERGLFVMRPFTPPGCFSSRLSALLSQCVLSHRIASRLSVMLLILSEMQHSLLPGVLHYACALSLRKRSFLSGRERAHSLRYADLSLCNGSGGAARRHMPAWRSFSLGKADSGRKGKSRGQNCPRLPLLTLKGLRLAPPVSK